MFMCNIVQFWSSDCTHKDAVFVFFTTVYKQNKYISAVSRTWLKLQIIDFTIKTFCYI